MDVDQQRIRQESKLCSLLHESFGLVGSTRIYIYWIWSTCTHNEPIGNLLTGSSQGVIPFFHGVYVLIKRYKTRGRERLPPPSTSIVVSLLPTHCHAFPTTCLQGRFVDLRSSENAQDRDVYVKTARPKIARPSGKIIGDRSLGL